ncbi:hypothetical protein LZ30DRAFT_701076 [Colletotrichum cereale]|nr:hypothetical protein LZ30DRAFT_701076 [Colletotrichum cereale]
MRRTAIGAQPPLPPRGWWVFCTRPPPSQVPSAGREGCGPPGLPPSTAVSSSPKARKQERGAIGDSRL